MIELVLERLEEETTEAEYSTFHLYYLETPRKRKKYEEIALSKDYFDKSGSRKAVKRVRLKFLELCAYYGVVDFYQKEISTGCYSNLTPGDLTTKTKNNIRQS